MTERKDFMPSTYTTLLEERDCSVQLFEHSIAIGDGNESIEIEYKDVFFKVRQAMDEAARKLGWIE